MRLDFSIKKKDIIQSVATAFLPRKVLIPLEQEKGVLCAPLVKAGDVVQEGQVVAEDSTVSHGAKIHASIPGVVQGVRNCSASDGRSKPAIEIKLRGSFSHIGKSERSFDWKSWGAASILNRVGALGVMNTFSMREPRSLEADIAAVKDVSEARIFIRLFDEDPSCQTDSTLAKVHFEKVLSGAEILKEILQPKKIVFACAKNDSQIQTLLLPLRSDEKNLVLFVDTKNYPCGKKASLAPLYKKLFKSSESERQIIENSLFVDAASLVVLSDALVYNTPVERVYVHVFGDCLKSSAVLKVSVGESLENVAKQLGLEQKKIGKIIVNGALRGYSVPSLETPVSKDVKSVAFISKNDVADYSSAVCVGCGSCRAACPAKIYPDIIFSHVVKAIKTPQDFIRSSVLCIECGVCDAVCPTKLPLCESVKILKDKQNV